MKFSVTWKSALLGLIAVGAVIYFLSGPDGGRYQPPRVADRESEPIADFTRAKFADIVKSMGSGRLIAAIEKGLSDHEVRLRATAHWHSLDEAARRDSARALWTAWANLHPPHQRYKTRIVIVDANGRKIGGSRLLDPSKIWVRKR